MLRSRIWRRTGSSRSLPVRALSPDRSTRSTTTDRTRRRWTSRSSRTCPVTAPGTGSTRISTGRSAITQSLLARHDQPHERASPAQSSRDRLRARHKSSEPSVRVVPGDPVRHAASRLPGSVRCAAYRYTRSGLDTGGAAVSAETIAPSWMHELVTAQQYDSWSAEQCAGIEIVDAMVVVSPCASKRHNRIAKLLAVAL